MRSTNAETTNPLLTQTQPTGSLFGAVLASTATESNPVASAAAAGALKGSTAGAPTTESALSQSFADAVAIGAKSPAQPQLAADKESTWGSEATKRVAPAVQSTTPAGGMSGSERLASRDGKAQQPSGVAAVVMAPHPEKAILPMQPIAGVAPLGATAPMQTAISVAPAAAPVLDPVAPAVRTGAPVVKAVAPLVRAAAPVIPQSAASVKPGENSLEPPTMPGLQPAMPVVPPTTPAVQPNTPEARPSAMQSIAPATLVATSAVQAVAPAVQAVAPAVQPGGSVLSPGKQELVGGQQNERSAGAGTSVVPLQPVTADRAVPAPVEGSMPAEEHAGSGARSNGATAPNPTSSAQDDIAARPTTAPATNDGGSDLQQNLLLVATLPSNLFLPDAGLAASDFSQSGAGAPGGKGTQNAAASGTISKISDAASVGGTGRNGGADNATAASGTHSVQGSPATNATGSQAGQASQAGSGGAPVAAKSPDGGAQANSAAIAIGSQAAVHDVRRAGDGVSDGSHSSELTAATVSIPRENGESTQTSAISTARLIQTMNETGMQVGMRSAEFGDISIRTSVSQQQVLAQISVDHGDLGKAIAMHLPAVQSKLGEEFGLRASIEVHESGASFSGEQGSSSAGQQRPYARSVQPQNISAEAESLNPVAVAAAWDGNRLDVRA